MRLKHIFAGLAAVSALSGAALGQALETIGHPIPGGTGFQPAATELAREMQWLDHMILIIITAITLFVVALMAVASWKFNARRNPVPAKFTHNTPIEIAWTLIPIVVLVFIGSFSLPALYKSQTIPVADITIKATGNQWYWTHESVDEGVSFDSYMIGSPATGGANMMTPEVEQQLIAAGYRKEDFLLATDTAVVIPVGKTIFVQVTATDVIHAWKIPAFGVMQDAVPGRLAHLWFTAEKEGIYFGQCSELCGLMHTYMPITVKVVSQEAYDKWLAGAKNGDLTLASN